jgi:hypothetical protein
MRRSLLALLLTCTAWACAYNLSDDQLDVVETGTASDAQQQPFLPWLLRDVRLLVGADGTPWLAMPTEAQPAATTDGPDLHGGLLGGLTVRRLAAPFDSYAVPPQQLNLFPSAPAQAICAYRRDPQSGRFVVSLHRADLPTLFEFPGGPTEPQLLCGQRSLAYWQAEGSSGSVYSLHLLRLQPDGSVVHRQLPWPADARPDLQQGPIAFDDQEDVLLVVDSNYQTSAVYLDTPDVVNLGVLYWGDSRHGRYVSIDLDGNLLVFDIASRTNQAVGFRLGPVGQLLGVDERRRQLVTCDWDGLRAVGLPLPGRPSPTVAPQQILDPDPCLVSGSQLPALTRPEGAKPPLPSPVLTYTPATSPPGSEVRALRFDRSRPPKVLIRLSSSDSDLRILGSCQDLPIAYSFDPIARYGPGVSDGWIGDYRFMERGRELRYDPACQWAFFKEHAADVRKLGELRALPLPPSGQPTAASPAPLRLGRNVGFNRVAPDGRLLAVVDLGVVGPQNRVQLIDPDRRQAQNLLSSLAVVTGALFIGSLLPDRREVLLEARDQDPGRQTGLLLLTLPPPARSDR